MANKKNKVYCINCTYVHNSEEWGDYDLWCHKVLCELPRAKAPWLLRTKHPMELGKCPYGSYRALVYLKQH